MSSQYVPVAPPDPKLDHRFAPRAEYLVIRWDPIMQQWLPPRPAVTDKNVAQDRLRTWRRQHPRRHFRMVVVETTYKLVEDA
jgi:hypothetical protein